MPIILIFPFRTGIVLHQPEEPVDIRCVSLAVRTIHTENLDNHRLRFHLIHRKRPGAGQTKIGKLACIDRFLQFHFRQSTACLRCLS